MMTVKIRYKHPEDSVSKLIVNKFKGFSISPTKPSDNLHFAAAVAGFGMLLRDSEFKGNATYEQVLAMARRSTGDDRFGYRKDFIRLVETAMLLSD